MSSATLLNQVGELSASLGSIDSEIAELRQQLKSFAGEADDLLVALPVDFDYDSATARLTQLLKDRHRVSTALQDSQHSYDTTRKAELNKQLSKLSKEHMEACKEVLACEIALARACKKERTVRLIAADLTGTLSGPFVHFGPGGPLSGAYDLDDPQSVLAYHIKEALERGITKQGAKELEGIAH